MVADMKKTGMAPVLQMTPIPCATVVVRWSQLKSSMLFLLSANFHLFDSHTMDSCPNGTAAVGNPDDQCGDDRCFTCGETGLVGVSFLKRLT